MEPRGARRVAMQAGVLVALLAGALFAAFPVFWMASSSFKSNPEIFELPPRIITDNFSSDAYWSILTNPVEVRFFVNSYVVALSVTVLTLVVAILAGWLINDEAITLWIVSGMAVILAGARLGGCAAERLGLMVTLQLYNTYPALILTYMVFTLSYAIIMMTGYFNTLPRELDEAVKVDGAGPMMALWRILVPLSIPGLVSVGIYTFMIAWNEYLFALTLTRTEDMRTVPIGIQLLMGQHAYRWNEMMAMSILGSLPVLVLFLVFQRYFVGGLTTGAVKN